MWTGKKINCHKQGQCDGILRIITLTKMKKFWVLKRWMSWSKIRAFGRRQVSSECFWLASRNLDYFFADNNGIFYLLSVICPSHVILGMIFIMDFQGREGELETIPEFCAAKFLGMHFTGGKRLEQK